MRSDWYIRRKHEGAISATAPASMSAAQARAPEDDEEGDWALWGKEMKHKSL